MTVRLGKTSKQPKQSGIVCGERALKLAPWINSRLTPGALSGELGSAAMTEKDLISLPICGTG